MLAARSRLRSAQEFRRTLRQGVKAARPSLVLHLNHADSPESHTRVGFVVSRAVGPAVQRNRVKRRLRHASAPLVAANPTGLTAVVRALPAASHRLDLAADLRSAWGQGLSRLEGR